MRVESAGAGLRQKGEVAPRATRKQGNHGERNQHVGIRRTHVSVGAWQALYEEVLEEPPSAKYMMTEARLFLLLATFTLSVSANPLPRRDFA